MTPATVGEVTTLQADIAKLLVDQTNAVVIQRGQSADQTGKGQLYYTTHLKTYQPVEQVEPLDRGVTSAGSIGWPTAASADRSRARSRQPSRCPPITQAKVGDVIDVKLTIVVPNTLYYLIVEDPLPAGTEAIDTSLRTTSSTAQGPEVQQVKPGAQGQPAAKIGAGQLVDAHPRRSAGREGRALRHLAGSGQLRVQLPDPGQPARRVPDPAADRVPDVSPGGVGTRGRRNIHGRAVRRWCYRPGSRREPGLRQLCCRLTRHTA